MYRSLSIMRGESCPNAKAEPGNRGIFHRCGQMLTTAAEHGSTEQPSIRSSPVPGDPCCAHSVQSSHISAAGEECSRLEMYISIVCTYVKYIYTYTCIFTCTLLCFQSSRWNHVLIHYISIKSLVSVLLRPIWGTELQSWARHKENLDSKAMFWRPQHA